nr:two-component regulator propeller domain-containing protein [Calditrichia bacterium]
GNVWVGLQGVLSRFDAEVQNITQYLFEPNPESYLPSTRIWDLEVDQHNFLWLATENGIFCFNPNTEKFNAYPHQALKPQSPRSNFMTSVLEDRSGNLWFGSGSMWGRARGGGFGIEFVNRRKPHIKHIPREAENGQNSSNFNVHTTFETRDGDLWVGTSRNGLFRFDNSKSRFTRYLHDENDPTSISQNSVMSLHEDRDGVLWVGTFDIGLNRYNAGEDNFTRFQNDPEDTLSLSRNRVTDIFEDSRRRLWVATYPGGLNLMNTDKKTFTRFLHDPEDETSIGSNYLSSVIEDKSGFLWVGTSVGISRFDPVSKKFTRYLYDPDNPQSLNNNFVWHMLIDSSGQFWLATSGGLLLFEPETDKFIPIAAVPDLPDNRVCDIIEQKRGILWLSTDGGISRYEVDKGQFRNYYMRDGLRNSLFSFGRAHKGADGTLYFSGTLGVDYFHPDQMVDTFQSNPVVFTRLRYYEDNGGKTVEVTDDFVAGLKSIRLGPNQQNFTVGFTHLNFANPLDNQYAYSLGNTNAEWIPIGNRNDITFSNLPPGDYTLKVRSADKSGQWSDQIATLDIAIIPPWYRTTAAYGIYLISLALLIWWGRRYEMSRVKLRNDLEIRNIETRQLKELDSLKSRFFAGISHEFRTPLTIILTSIEKWMPADSPSPTRKDLNVLHRSALGLEKLINQILDLTRLEAGKMSLTVYEEDLIASTRFLMAAFQSLADQKNIDLQFIARAGEIRVWLDREKYETIFNNLLSNALKFTPEGGRVSVEVSLAEGVESGVETTAILRVVDNGVGIPENQHIRIFDRFHQVDSTPHVSGSGLGLALVKELVHLHQGEIGVKSTPDEGSVFTVFFKPGRSHFPEEFMGPAKTTRLTRSPALPISAWMDMPEKEIGYPADPSPVNPLPEGGRKSILIVEDHDDMRRMIREAFEETFEILKARDGIESLKLAEKHAPDLIISDVMMPRMDGVEMCRKLKNSDSTSHIPVIMLTAKVSQTGKLQGLESGADAYLSKPFQMEELRVRSVKLMEQREQLRKTFQRTLVLEPAEIAVNSRDEIFLENLKNLLEENLADPDFQKNQLAAGLGVSGKQMDRKLNALTGNASGQFIRLFRLKRAADLLKEGAGNVTEICFSVGFQNTSHFAKVFKDTFGLSPKDYQNQHYHTDD